MRSFILLFICVQFVQTIYTCTSGYISQLAYNMYAPSILPGFYKRKSNYFHVGIRVTPIYKIIVTNEPLTVRLIYNKKDNHPWKLVSLIHDAGIQKIVESDHIEEISSFTEDSRAFFDQPKIIMQNIIEPRPFGCMYSYGTEEYIEEIILYYSDHQDKEKAAYQVVHPFVGEQCFEFTAPIPGRFIFYLMNEAPWDIVSYSRSPRIYKIIIDVAYNCSGSGLANYDEDIPNHEWAYFQVYC